ncbi:hypothetical protein S40293_04090 [Stachybotrys chartarum IBT 40293]|nr:hypothetical protein S40293_04090 [Stachybotrys chartarum IBT 40293]
MAPSMVTPLSPYQFPTSPVNHSSRVFGSHEDEHSSNSATYRHSRRSSRRFSSVDTSNISDVVYSLKRRSSDELGTATSAKLLNVTYDGILEWIRSQRLSHVPPEGSSYDKVLAWAQLFVDRLHSFDLAIEEFAGDSYLATQLTYGYCAILLDLGKENASALMISFGFFYNMSLSLANLLERIELFTVSQDIREQLVLALSDLVTLVASVATRFHNATRGLAVASISVDIHSTFPNEIKSFVERCNKTAEAMWRHQLVKEGIDVSQASAIKSIKTWLSPEDHVHGNLVSTVSHLAHDREELTCLWMGPHLTRFLKTSKNVLSIHGKRGSGKSVLASVLVDYLQHPIGGVTYKSIYVPINNRVPAETSPRTVVKTILNQLFEQRIGNIQLLHILAEAVENSGKATSDSEYDQVVWTAVQRALAAALPGAKELVVVVDGIDEASCAETELFQKLAYASTNGMDVRLITLGAEKPSPAGEISTIHITDEVILDDINAVIKGQFENNKSFKSMPEMQQETITMRLAEASTGSFLWAKLAVKRLRNEDTPEKLQKAVDTVLSTKPTVYDFVSKTLQSPSVTEDAKMMLLWLATAERPLSTKMLSTLASVRVDQNTIPERHLDVLSILKPVNSLVFLQDGFVYLRHGLIRETVLDMSAKGKLVAHIKDHHLDLVTRMLFYIKSTVTQSHEPSLTSLDAYETSQLLTKYPLLNFAARHWPYHLRKTQVFNKEGEAAASKTISKVFPNSTTALLLQSTLWAHKATPVLLLFQATVTNICRHLFTGKDPITLQSIISLVLLCRQLGLIHESIPLFYEAITTSNALLTSRSNVTMQLASAFLEVTSSMITSERTDIMNKRAEVYTVLIECYRVQYGQQSEILIATLNQFADHYRMIGETRKAQELVRSVSTTTFESGEHESSLHVHLRKGEEHERSSNRLLLDVEERDELIETEKTVSRDFESYFGQAEMYLKEGRMDLAEHSWIETWQTVSREYHSSHSVVWEKRKLKAVIGYSRFLQSQKRNNDAASVLCSFWEEYKQSSMSITDSSVTLFYELAKISKSLGLPIQALSILKHCTAYYHETCGTNTSTYKEVQQTMNTLSRDIMQSAASSNGLVSESLLEELILDASTTINDVDQVVFAATFALLKSYTAQHRWQDATRFAKRILQSIWSSLFSSSPQDVSPPSKLMEQCVELAESLGDCYHARRRLAKEEDIRFRLYRCLRANRKVDDKLRESVTAKLTTFLSRTTQVDNIIDVRQEILDDNIEFYGLNHPTVIKMLWELAELARPRPIFIDYYQKIIRVLNKDADMCNKDTIEPCIIVANELWSKGQFPEALPYLKLIFVSFLKKPQLSSKLQDSGFVRETFSRYTQCLRNVRSDFSILHRASVEYQAQCKTVFGANASITVQSTMHLARLCQESKRYEHEAVALYEELLHIDSSEVDRHEITSVLDSLYEEEALNATSTKSVATSSTQVDTAVKVLTTRMHSLRQSYGFAHEEYLSQLTELVKLRMKRKETQWIASELKETMIKVLLTEKSSYRLISAASTIASNYLATSQVQQASEISEEIYRQVIMKDTTNSKTVGYDVSSLGRESLVFLAQFEYSLRRNSTASATTDQILSELTTQYLYFQEFRELMTSRSGHFQHVTVAAARLYQSLEANRKNAASRVFDDYKNYFLRYDGKAMKSSKPQQVDILLQTLLDHFSKYKSNNFVRSVGISGNEHVSQLLQEQNYQQACDLAIATFTFVSSQGSYHTPIVAKLILILGMTISGQHLKPLPDGKSRQMMLQASAVILPDVLHVLNELKISLEEFSMSHLNILLGLLGEQKDYKTLAWLLTKLWNARETKTHWHPSTTLALGRRFILAKYLVGEAMSAIRLAEDIVYNCRRVHGTRHASTLDMSILLTQLYTSVAQTYQSQKSGQDMAARYYKKSAAIHENILRALTDSAYAEMEDGVDMSYSSSGSHNGDMEAIAPSPQSLMSEGVRVRQHLQYLKLSLQRLGGWPKDMNEYLRLSKDAFEKFSEELKGLDGMEKWDFKTYGSGKAESDDDVLDVRIRNWEIVDDRM